MSRFQISPARTPSTHDASRRLPGGIVVCLLASGASVQLTSFSNGPLLTEALLAGEIDPGYAGPGLSLHGGGKSRGAAPVMSVMLLIVAIGVTLNQILFAPLERRVAARWGFGPSVA